MHYKNMGLYGSEFWSYSLKKRVGKLNTRALIEGAEPIIGKQALELGLVDDVIPELENFDQILHEKVLAMKSSHINNRLNAKLVRI